MCRDFTISLLKGVSSLQHILTLRLPCPVTTIFPFLPKTISCQNLFTIFNRLKYYFHIKFTMLDIRFIKFSKVCSYATITTINFQNISSTLKSYLVPSFSQSPLPSQATLIVLPFLEFHIKRTFSM